MPIIRDDALVIKTVATGEADVLVHLLMAERGRRCAMARGGKQSRKRFGGALQVFTHLQGRFTLKRLSPFYQLDSAECLCSFPGLGTDLARFYLASYFVELADQGLMEGETYPDVYELLLFFLRHLNEHPASLTQRVMFELKLLAALGHGAPLDAYSTDTAYYNPTTGELCRAVLPERGWLPLSAESQALLQEGPRLSLSELAGCRLTRRQVRETLALHQSVMTSAGFRRFKTLPFVEEMLPLD